MHQSGTNVGRRTALKTIGAGIALGGMTMPVSALGGSNQLSHELNLVRSSTRKYRDVATARADGYMPIGGYVPGMGFHFVNFALISPDENAAVDLSEPPILVYYTNGSYHTSPGAPHDDSRDGDLLLGGVEFAHVGTQGVSANLFSDEQSRRTLLTSEADGWEFVPGPNITALHVWVHRNNPLGVFHPSNPTID